MAGVAGSNITVAAAGDSLSDVTMAELAHVLLPQLRPKLPSFEDCKPEWLSEQRALWLKRQQQRLHCLLTPAACMDKPWEHIATAVAQQGNVVDQQVLLIIWSCERDAPPSMYLPALNQLSLRRWHVLANEAEYCNVMQYHLLQFMRQ